MDSHIIKREMSISLNEFYRLLPIALRDHTYDVKNDKISFNYENGSIRINITKKTERKIASLVLPVIHISFEFSNVRTDSIDQFMSEFSQAYLRGGG